jgi:hypothetical protein
MAASERRPPVRSRLFAIRAHHHLLEECLVACESIPALWRVALALTRPKFSRTWSGLVKP